MDSRTLFRQISSASGLSPILAPGTLRRALRDVDADPATATPSDYYRALPALGLRLRVYLPEREAETRIEKIRRILLEIMEREPS